MQDIIIKKLSSHLSNHTSNFIVIVATLIVICSSVPLVYVLIALFDAKYTTTIFVMSIAAPFLMVPPTIIIIIKLSKYLQHFKLELEEEIEKNKKKDILLFEQARFVLMGEMIANISHQWKQPLNTMGLAVVSAKTGSFEREMVERSFDIIENNVRYLANTIDDFMSFFDKRSSGDIKDIKSIVEEVESISSAVVISNLITLNIKINESASSVKMTSSISQVLINLINNSSDAFTDMTKDKKIDILFSKDNNSLEIKCCDNAGGIDASIIEKVFDPYFTTKEKSQGTGIGLYMTKQIVQKIFNGHIEISTEADLTCFIIKIPYSDKCVFPLK